MSNANTTYLSGLLERMDLFSPAQVVELIEAARESDLSITEIVAAEAYAPEEAFLEQLADVLRLPYVRLNTSEIEQDVLDRLPTKAVFQYHVIPVTFANGALLVATNDPLD
ncbi:MAG: hypothetical protein QF565_17480, partial [Arenicellales bacterium]|nr:hypothetical protein [Arenicellales bacterium]